MTQASYDAFAIEAPESDWLYQGIQKGWTLARHRVGGTDALYLHLAYGGVHVGDEVIGLARVVRIPDLATVGVLANRFTHPTTVVCGQGNYRETALDITYAGLVEPFVSRFHPETGGWTFAPYNDAFSGTHAFDIDDPSQLFVTSLGAVFKLDESNGTPISVRTNTADRYPASLGDTGVWTEGSDVWAIRGTSAPIRVITGGPEYPCSIGVTPEWIFGAGEQTASGLCRQFPTNGRVWRAKRNADGSVGSVEFGPTLIVEAFFSYARGWGDYIAFASTIQGKVELFVVRLSDWKAWQLKKATNDSFHASVWGVDDKYLYAGISHSNLELEELRRYPLANLDDVASVLSTN
ncbi:MAG: hypothetical protein AB7K71_00385 [Polyangiaceae bacterium]